MQNAKIKLPLHIGLHAVCVQIVYILDGYVAYCTNGFDIVSNHYPR